MLYTYFSLIFERISVKLGWYIGSIPSINPMKFQVRTPNVMVTVRQGQGHEETTLENMLYAYFSLIFEQISVKLGWYIGSIPSIYPMNFQVHTPKVMVTVRQNNSSIHPTYFCSSRQQAKTCSISVPGCFDQEFG